MPKRALDIVTSFLGLFVLCPILVFIALGIKVGSPGPVFYRGVRVGRFGRPFRIFKFRTMVQTADSTGVSSTAADDGRITKFGHFLRRYKLDELPQLINVLKGDMSLVGPRPQVAWAVEKYKEEEKAILSIRPGVTDFASLRYRDEGEILRGSMDPDRDYFEKIHPEKMRLSLEYVRRQSFWLDCKILLKTIAVTIFRPNPGKSETSTDGNGIP